MSVCGPNVRIITSLSKISHKLYDYSHVQVSKQCYLALNFVLKASHGMKSSEICFIVPKIYLCCRVAKIHSFPLPNTILLCGYTLWCLLYPFFARNKTAMAILACVSWSGALDRRIRREMLDHGAHSQRDKLMPPPMSIPLFRSSSLGFSFTGTYYP